MSLSFWSWFSAFTKSSLYHFLCLWTLPILLSLCVSILQALPSFIPCILYASFQMFWSFVVFVLVYFYYFLLRNSLIFVQLIGLGQKTELQVPIWHLINYFTAASIALCIGSPNTRPTREHTSPDVNVARETISGNSLP